MKTTSRLPRVFLTALTFALAALPLRAQVGIAKETVGVSVVTQVSPPQITLSWMANANPNLTTPGHSIFRRNAASDRNTLFSADGLSWTPAASAPSDGLESVAQGTPSGVSTFIGISNDPGVYRSTDGSTWTRIAFVDDTADTPRIVAYGNGRYITNIGGYFFSSTDSTAWTKSTRYATLANFPVIINDLTFANGTWVAVGRGYGGGSIANAEGEILGYRMGIITSTNGTTWTLRQENDTTTAPANENIGRTLHGVAFGSSAWVAVGLGGNIYRSTNNGTTWTAIANSITNGSSTITHLYSVAYANGAFVAVGTSPNSTNGTPVILRSTDDGLTWSTVSLGGSPATRQTLNRIRVNGGQFHAVGDGGAYILSTDGLTWTARSTTNTSPQKDIAFGSALQVIASQPGWGNTPLISGLSPSTLTYTDTSPQIGIAYDYAVRRHTLGGGTGGLHVEHTPAAIGLPVVEQRGTVILVVENTLPTALANDYSTFRNNLVGDGWKVEEILVPRALTSPTAPQRLAEVQTIRSAIQALYQADPTGVNTVLLIGRVPVPISGFIGPDGHAGRPFPADVYYADVSGTWTDTRDLPGQYTPGDGKFDQNTPPVLPVLAIGRIDFGDLPAFSISETQLLQRYFQKNHRFRHGITTANRKSYAANNWGGTATSVSLQDYTSLPVILGYSAALGFSNFTYSYDGGWKTALGASSYLLSFGSGGGSNTSASGIVTTTDFTTGNYPTFFMTFYGSYFCEYNLSNNLLRSSLGMPDYGLTAQWSSHNPAYLGLNIPIGLSGVKDYIHPADIPNPNTQSWFNIYDAKLGDATLRIFPTKPASNLTLSASTGQITLNWSASTDTSIVGYHVYRATSLNGPFTRLTGAAITTSTPTGSAPAGTSFTDSTIAPATVYHYMVRAVKLETTNQGTHYALSQGIFATNEIPVIAPGQTLSAPTGAALSYTLTASNGPTSYALSSGSLPPGLTLNTSTGLISGTPTTPGVYTPSFTVTNGGGTSPAVSVTLTIVSSALIIHEPFAYTVGTNSPDPDGGANSNNGLPATNIGGTPGGTSTGVRGAWGTTTDTVAGLTYSNGNKTLVTSGAAARVNNADWGGNPVIYRNMTTDPWLAQRVGGVNTGNIGVSGTSLFVSLLAQTSSATNSAFRFSFKADGAANFYLNNTATGWALNNNGAGDVVATGATLALNTPTLLVLRFDFAATTTVSLWVNPPLGQTLGTAQATISGVNFPGFLSFQTRATVTNAMTLDELRVGTSLTAVTPFTEAPPAITAAQSVSGSIGIPFTYDVQATGVPTSYALATGSLPPGLSLNTSTGRLSGTPTAVGTYTPSFTASNGGGTSPAVAVTITIGNSPVLLTGSVIGTAGSYNNSGATVDKVFDGSLTTFFDAPTANGTWAGLDFGAGNEKILTEVRYAPRSTYESRIVNAIIQGSSSADFTTGVVNLYTISTAPTAGVLTAQSISNPTGFRYARILMANGSYGNVAELQFYGTAALPPPTGIQSFRTTYGLSTNGSQDLLTPAGDGVPNLLKYAFNLLGSGTGQAATLATPNATVLTPSGSAGLPYVSLLPAPSSTLQLTYLRRKASTSPGVTYTVEFSDDLVTWAVNGSATESVTSLDATFERVTVTDSVAAPAKRFVRVKVTQ